MSQLMNSICGAGATYIVCVSRSKPFSTFHIYIIQHFIQQDHFLLELVELVERLSAIIRFLIRFGASEDFHQLLCCGEISRRTASDELLKLRLLSLAIFLFKLFCRLQVL